MKKKVVISLVLASAVATSLVFFQNCSSNEFAFSTIASSATVTRTEIDLGGGLTQVTDSFLVRIEKATSIDMVWVVDNSGSMDTEAQAVRSNVLAFANSVEAEARLKMALISKIGNTGTGTYLPDSLLAKGSIEINRAVGSTDALMILGAALCAKASPLLPCADLVDANISGFSTNYENVHGALDGFYRVGAKKLFVIVTDDESRVTGPDFLQFLMQSYPNERPRVFGFVGLGADSPCQAAEGRQYEMLATETVGAVYNVCSPDWTAHFADLTKAVSVIANYEYELKYAAIKEVKSVQINGVELAPASYTVKNGVLTLNSVTAAALAGGTLVIVYIY